MAKNKVRVENFKPITFIIKLVSLASSLYIYIYIYIYRERERERVAS